MAPTRGCHFTRHARPAYNDVVSAADFDRHRYVSLTTFRKSGVAVATPVWFVAMLDKLYVYTASDSGKVKRLRNSERARIAPCDMRGRVLGESRDTTARLVSDPAITARIAEALRRKYGWQMWIANVGARLTGRVDRRAYIEIDF